MTAARSPEIRGLMRDPIALGSGVGYIRKRPGREHHEVRTSFHDDENSEIEDIDALEGYERDANGHPKSVPAELFMVGPNGDGNVWLGLQMRSEDGTLVAVQMRLEPEKAIMLGEMLMRAGDREIVAGPIN